MQFYLFLESHKGPLTCDTVRCSRGYVCMVKVRDCHWDEGKLYLHFFEDILVETCIFFRMQATNSALRIREGILRGCSFLRRFQVSFRKTLHLARNLLRQSTLQAHQKLRERNRSINKWMQLDFLSINIFMNLFEITSLTYLIRILAREIYKKLCSIIKTDCIIKTNCCRRGDLVRWM